MKRDAILSNCGTYRYVLTRSWDDALPLLVFIMLNPSKADASVDDPTILACVALAKAQGCGGIVVVNLFAFRATQPADMKAAPAPIGPKNDATIEKVIRGDKVKRVIAAWGRDGWYMNRCVDVKTIARCNGISLYCLGTTQDGDPKHPLARGKHRIPPTFEPLLWREAA